MNMSFDRNRAQVYCERLPGCDPRRNQVEAKENFRNHQLTESQARDLRNDLLRDALDFYFKGLLSFCEAVNSVCSNLFSWPTVKMYYGVYYFLRSSLAAKGVAIVRIRSLFFLKAQREQQAQTIGGKGGNSTHKGTIKVFQKLYKDSDILQSNLINDSNSYIWLMDARERVSYREREFKDPSASFGWEEIFHEIEKSSLNKVLFKYIEDRAFLFCFQEEHACLALPIQRFKLTRQDLINAGLLIEFPSEKKILLESLLDEHNLSNLKKAIFDV